MSRQQAAELVLKPDAPMMLRLSIDVARDISAVRLTDREGCVSRLPLEETVSLQRFLDP
jgi:hypothetical protein